MSGFFKDKKIYTGENDKNPPNPVPFPKPPPCEKGKILLMRRIILLSK